VIPPAPTDGSAHFTKIQMCRIGCFGTRESAEPRLVDARAHTSIEGGPHPGGLTDHTNTDARHVPFLRTLLLGSEHRLPGVTHQAH